MTVQSNLARQSYVISGTGPYSIPFYFLDDDNIIVIRTPADGSDAVTLTLTTDYTLSGAGDEDGGSLTLVMTGVDGDTLTIINEPEITQLTQYPQVGKFPAASHERALDKLTMIAKRIYDLASRSIRLNDGDPATSFELPVAVPGRYLGFGVTGALEALSGTAGVSDAGLVEYTAPGTGGVPRSASDKFYDVVTPLDYGAIGNGTINDGTALQNALNTGKDVYLPNGHTFMYTTTPQMTTHGQKISGPGKLKPVGAIDAIKVTGGCTGATVACTVEAPGQTAGHAVNVDNANRVNIDYLNVIDGFGGIYIKKANTVKVGFAWGTLRGPGLTWYGDNSNRSDVLRVVFGLFSVGAGYYGLDWDGNCHSLEIGYFGTVNGKGGIVRNTSGGSTLPAIGRFNHYESDYSSACGLEIVVGLDIDIVAPYINGATNDGIKIGATVNDYNVRLTGGKSIGNGGYGVNNLGGVMLFSGNTDLSSNTAGETNGSIWTKTPRVNIDGGFYMTLDGGNPIIAFDANDYIGFDRATNTLNYTFGGVLGAATRVAGGSPIEEYDTNDYSTYDRTNNIWKMLIGGTLHFQVGAPLGNFADDTAAATGGVPLYGYYRNGSVVMQRIL